MAEKRKKTSSKKTAKNAQEKPKAKGKKSKPSKKEDTVEDSGIVIVEEDFEVDKEKVNEERRAYLEEARSQEAYD